MQKGKRSITKAEWDEWVATQTSGRINMWLHPLAAWFTPSGNYEKMATHFASSDKPIEVEAR